jgi:hypothetical protein
MDIINYSVYFPVQIWEFKEEKLFRIQPPKIYARQPTEYEFYPHFVDSEPSISVENYNKIKKDFKLRQTIWVFNPSYVNNLSRGFSWLYLFHKDTYPFNTQGVFSIVNVPVEISMHQTYQGFSFLTYQYSIPNTYLLCLKRDRFRNIEDLVLVDEVSENDSDNDYMNFLPFKKNQDIPFYKVKIPDRYIFVYVFKEKPKEIYWRANSENICVPSENKKDYWSLMECVYHNVDKIQLRNVYIQSNIDPIADLIDGPEKKSHFLKMLAACILFMLLLITCLALVVSIIRSR